MRRGIENSEVLPPASVAVAVRDCPAGTDWASVEVKNSGPVLSSVTVLVSTSVLPSPVSAGLE
jgi:hypothetical protein